VSNQRLLNIVLWAFLSGGVLLTVLMLVGGHLERKRKFQYRGGTKLHWDLGFCLGGATLGLVFMILFVRMPHWVGDGPLAGFVVAIYLAVFVIGGGYLGYRLYKRYGCRLGLHLWQEDHLPRARECHLCARFQQPIDPFQETSEWKDVYLARDESTGRFSFKDAAVPLGRDERLIRGVPNP
jgi:hypothetical protein